MQANKLGWVSCIVLACLTACGTESTNVAAQSGESSEATLEFAPSDAALQSMLQSVEEVMGRKPGCPPAQGNTKGVGRPCSKSGGQCKGTGAPFCTVDVSSSTQYAFCTKMCFNDEQCGPSATCAANPHGSAMRGCVPNACL